MIKKISTPLTDKEIRSLKTGDNVLITGTIYTARDAAHKRLLFDIKKPPINLKDTIIYYCGPTPAMPGRPVGSAGPTTSGRMDGLLEPLNATGYMDVLVQVVDKCA